jgi:WD40 repeat protein/DNA-binding SARP family transcriptional activator/energy-coupling factor transporter ATP-binding protein EcfA2
MHFQILGPVEVHGDHGPVALGGAKPRALLAVLLLHANEPVSAERLALALWGEDAPGGAVKTVQVHVSRLRKALGDPNVISTTSAGYCLRVRPDELDAEVFERLVEDGRRALADGQPEHAARVLREGLALWRGQPLGDLALEPFARSETARLREGRLAAIELRVEADLATGSHADLVGELQSLVAEHPLRERLAGQLMLALYRCGRQTEALEVYRAARRVLISEIGVEPGHELRRLQDAILRQDESLEPEPTLADLPRELDAAASPPLLGRDPELDWLVDRWERARTGTGALIGLAGPRGAGKTRLAAQIAGRAHAAQDAVIYASGSGCPEPLRSALRRAGETSRATLLVIDDAERAERGVLDGLRELTAIGGLLILIIGEDARALERLGASAVLELAPLDVQAAHAIATLYAPGRAFEDVPAQWLLDSSGGVARRLHELASQWARREAVRRVGAVAGQAAAGREQLRSIQDELTGGVEQLQAADERLARAGNDNAPAICPYKGLASFDVADASYFFGRERLIAELVARLVGAPLLGIVGPSGSGKSSVTRAGLLPALASGVLPGSHEWTQVLMRPGEHPLRELAQALADVDDEPRIVIAVDQFEETFTMCEDEQERSAFIAELAAAAADPDGRYIVVMALRADFYGRCAGYPELSGHLAANHVLVGSMQRDELRRAIERPAERVGLRVDPELVDALVADVGDEPGALPLLETALLELWQRREGRRLRHSVYEQSEGVRGAVARLAEDAFGQLDEGQQILARGVLMRLASEGAAGGVERCRISLAELETDRNKELARAVALLTDRRLLTASAGWIELAHEALLREWPRLRDWIEADRAGLRLHRNLTAAAREWQGVNRDEDSLLRGTRLTETLEWARENPQSLNEAEREFLSANEARQQLEQTQRRRRNRFVIGGLSAAVVLVSVVALIALMQSWEADRQRDISASRGLAASATAMLDVDPALSLELALRALERRDTTQAENVLRQATYATRAIDVWPTHRGVARALSVSKDGLTVATGGDDGTIVVRRTDSGRLLSRIKSSSAPVIGVALSPDGRRVVGARDNGSVTISAIDGRNSRTVLDLSHEMTPNYGPNYGHSVSFSNNGRRLAVGALDGSVRVLRADGGGAVRRLRGHQDLVLDVGFSPDGTRVVSSDYHLSARAWDLRSGMFVALAHQDVESASFSPAGDRIATAGLDGIIRLWRADGSGPTRRIRIGVPLLSVRFSRNGRRLVTAGQDGVVRISDVHGGPVLDALTRHRGEATGAAFVTHEQVVSTGEDGTLRRWAPLGAAVLHGSFVSASFSPDGRRVLTGGDDGRARLFDPKTGAGGAIIGPDTAATSARYSTDGRRVVTASLDGAVRIANPRTGRSRFVVAPDRAAAKTAADLDPSGKRIVSGGFNAKAIVQAVSGDGRPVVLRGHRAGLTDVRFSRDGRHVLTASGDGTARIWNAVTGKVERTLEGHLESVSTAQYSADGKRIVTAGVDGTVRVWPASGPGRPVILRGHEGGVNAAVFSPDGTRVVSAGLDGTIRVWAADGGETLLVLYRHQGGARSVSFSPDGKAVVSSGEDGVARVSSCEVCGALGEVRRIARTRATRALSPIERERFLPDS